MLCGHRHKTEVADDIFKNSDRHQTSLTLLVANKQKYPGMQ